MPLDILGLVSIDTLDFLGGKRYVGGGGLASAWVSSMWNVETTLYSVNSNTICNRVIESNIVRTPSYFCHIPLGATNKTTHFTISQQTRNDEYAYKISRLDSAFNELLAFLDASKYDQYIKLPASNFFPLRNYVGKFSVNPQGKFCLQDYCNEVTTSGFIFLNKAELLACSRTSLLEALEYIEYICRPFVITLGKEGAICYYSATKTWWYCPSLFCSNFLSTLGCGDSFAGGFLAGFAKKLSIGDCLAQGTLSAYCAMQSPSNMITQWPNDTSLQNIVAIDRYIKVFDSARALYEYISSGQDVCVDLPVEFDLTQHFCWIYE